MADNFSDNSSDSAEISGSAAAVAFKPQSGLLFLAIFLLSLILCVVVVDVDVSGGGRLI